MRWWQYWLLASLVLASLISLYASSSPDGLERVAEDHGFIEAGEGHEVLESPFPDYMVPAIGDERLSAALAGLLGVAVMYALTVVVAKALR